MTPKLSKSNKAILTAYRKGYRVFRNAVVLPDGTRQRGYSYSSREPKQYLKIYIKEAGTWIYVHRLAGFQRFARQIFGKYVTHKNENRTDNRLKNLKLSAKPTYRRGTGKGPMTGTEEVLVRSLHLNGHSSFDI